MQPILERRYSKPTAFSLVELSIVLVILGLLVGGVLAGKSLIRASELRSVTTQLQGFMAADKAFRDKYFNIAGDMPNATQFWGAADADPWSCTDALIAGVSGTLTCNGNGDSYLSMSGTQVTEKIIYWQHMANAGLISGKYTGYGNTNSSGYQCCFVIPANSPTGKISNSLWMPWSSRTWPFSYQFGGQTPPFGAMPASTPTGNILRPEELWSIDTKIDDGKPNAGKVKASYDGTLPNNCTSGLTATDTYTLTYTDIACYAFFYTQ